MWLFLQRKLRALLLVSGMLKIKYPEQGKLIYMNMQDFYGHYDDRIFTSLFQNDKEIAVPFEITF